MQIMPDKATKSLLILDEDGMDPTYGRNICLAIQSHPYPADLYCTHVRARNNSIIARAFDTDLCPFLGILRHIFHCRSIVSLHCNSWPTCASGLGLDFKAPPFVSRIYIYIYLIHEDVDMQFQNLDVILNNLTLILYQDWITRLHNITLTHILRSGNNDLLSWCDPANTTGDRDWHLDLQATRPI